MKILGKLLLFLWCVYIGTCFIIGIWVVPDILSSGQSTINTTSLIIAVVIGTALGIKWFYDEITIKKKLDRLKELESKQTVT